MFPLTNCPKSGFEKANSEQALRIIKQFDFCMTEIHQGRNKWTTKDSLSSTTQDKLRANLLLRRMRTTAATNNDAEISLNNFVAATHAALGAPDSRRPHRSNHCRRQNLELGVCINLSIPLMHLTPNPCCQTEVGQLPHRARSIAATNSDVEIFLDDFVAPVQGSAWRA